MQTRTTLIDGLEIRLVAIDLPGFGHSEERADLFTPEDMAEFLRRFLTEYGLGPLEVGGALADIIAAPGIEVFADQDIRATVGTTAEPVASRATEPDVADWVARA